MTKSGQNKHIKSTLLSIVIPAYQEQKIIGKSLNTLHAYLQKEKLLTKCEVIVVSADGKDKTAQIAKRYAKLFQHFQVIQPGPKAGKGRDVRVGVLASKAKYVLFMDADLATPLHHIRSLLASLEDGADIVIGVRRLTRIHSGVRMYVSIFGNLLSRLILLPRISDTQCGFKGFTRQAAQKIFRVQQINGWGFDMEVLAIGKNWKLRIQEVLIDDWHDPKIEQGLVGESRISAVVNTLTELFIIRIRLLRGVYDAKPTTQRARSTGLSNRT